MFLFVADILGVDPTQIDFEKMINKDVTVEKLL